MKKILPLLCIIIFSANLVLGQEKTVTGKVTDENGEPLIGVTIVKQGTSDGTTSDLDGNFVIQATTDDILVFSFVGYETQTITVSNQSAITVQLQTSTVQLGEVVVTAFGIEREKKALGYAVTEVGGEEVSTVRQNNVINSLSGRVAGVVITSASSGPAGGTRVIIRGNNSISGNNQPLYIVDGVPIDNSGFGSAAGSGTGEYRRADYGTGISDINPDDVESISVLKGPNAAALYGSRASNGAIIITTKKGSSQDGLGVSFSTSYVSENPLLLPTYQNEYGQGSNGTITDLSSEGGSWGPKMDGSNQPYYTGETRPYTAQPDNVKDFFRTGSTWINTLAISGGSDRSNFRISYTNNDVKSILENSDLRKHNFTTRGSMNVSEKLNIDSKVTYFFQESNQRPELGTEGVLSYLWNIPRNVDINDLKDYQDENTLYVNSVVGDDSGNPYWVLLHDVNHDTRNRVYGFMKATYEFSDWLTAFARLGSDYVNHDIETVSKYGHWFFRDGRFNYSTRSTSETNADFLFMVDKDLTSDINLTANFGGNALYQTYKSFGVRGENFKIPSKSTLANANETFPSYTPLREKKIHSLYGQASFSYQNIAFIDITGRNDWSSTLGADNRSYFYPSVSASLLVNELINPSATYFDLFKIRTSWAQVGGDTGPYQLDIAFNLQADGYLGLTTLSRPSIRLNPDIKPERTTSFEVGTEIRALNNKVYLDMSYYDIKTTDLIYPVPVPSSTGYSAFLSNIGEIQNKGWEVVLGATAYDANDLTVDLNLNLGSNKNTINELFSDLESITFTTTNSGTVAVVGKVGGGFGDIYGKTLMMDPNGNTVVDANGRPLASNDRVLLGNYQPDFIGGFTTSITYKNIRLNILLDARFGGELYSGLDASMDGSGTSERTLEYRETGITVDGVVNTGTSEAPVYEANTNQITGQEYWGSMSGISENYIYSQSNIMLRELSLSYPIPSSVLGNGFIKSADINLIGRNLAFLMKDMDNFDPASSFSTSSYAQGVIYGVMPTTRSFGLSVNIKF